MVSQSQSVFYSIIKALNHRERTTDLKSSPTVFSCAVILDPAPGAGLRDTPAHDSSVNPN